MTLVFLLSAAFALGPECNQTAGVRAQARIERVVAQAVKPVRTPDTRAYITQPKLQHFTLSPEDVQRIRKTTGICTCPGVKGSCGLGLGGEILLSNVHLLVDEEGQTRRPISDCKFQNQAIPPDPPISFVFKKDSFRIGTMLPYKEGEHDHAAIKLAGRVDGAKPFPVDAAGVRLRPGQWIMAVSGLQTNLPAGMKQDQTTPIVQECVVTETSYDPGHTGTFGSSCMATPYASGSFNFIRDARGELQVVGIMQAICDATLYGKACNDKGTKVNNIMIRSNYLEDIMALSGNSRMAHEPGGGGREL